MAVRPPSIEPGIWQQLSPKQQDMVAGSVHLASGQRTDAQKAVFQHIRGLRAAGGTSPSAGGGAGGGGGAAGPSGGLDLKKLLGTTSSTAVADDLAKLLKLLNLAGFQGSDAQSILRQLDLGYSFTGAEQFRRNQGGEFGFAANDPVFQNVSMQSILTDRPSLLRVVGEMMGMLEEGGDVQALWRARQSQVPEWAPQVYDQLATQGVPWSTELFGSPEVQYRDPTKPLFAEGTHPASLFGLTGLQAGEEAFYRGLSAAELMTQVYPLYHGYHHRDPGAPVPPGFEGGLTFGSPHYIDELSGAGLGSPFVHSPVRSTDAYKRWSALGMPGDPTMGGMIRGGAGYFNPLTGESGITNPGSFPGLSGGILSGDVKPEWFYPFEPSWDPHREWLRTLLGRVGTAAFLGDPSEYFSGSLEAFNPAFLDPTVIQRLLAVMTGGAAPESGEEE